MPADVLYMPVPVPVLWLCRQQVDKKTVLENLDLLLLVMDEVVDGG
jgi:hypothetical protein